LKIQFSFIFILILLSCNYPDIDSVPDFKNLNITEEESIDLCKLANTDIKDLSECLNEINLNLKIE